VDGLVYWMAWFTGLLWFTGSQNYSVNTYQYELNWNRNYVDVLSGNTFNVTSQWLNLSVPARSARMWVLR
jgi:hypothetical protein